MSRWQQFLITLPAAIDALAERVHLATTDPPRYGHPVVARGTAKVAAAGELLIGVGRLVRTDADGRAHRVEHPGICLNNKGAHLLDDGPAWVSVTDFVLATDNKRHHDWQARLGDNGSPTAILAKLDLVVEDASPDSCFALICFLAIADSVPVEQIPIDWVDYIRRWERGDVSTTGEPFSSYGALHNALVHSLLDGALGQAWVEGLRLLQVVLLHQRPPQALPMDAIEPELQHARALIAFEQQSYRDSLQFATMVQLRLPLRDGGRRCWVDAYLAREALPLGTLKVFLRNDRNHARLGNGFTLVALYRPGEEGTGNELTVSVTPNSGVSLHELWFELERIEDAAWQGRRPRQHPRPGILGYAHGLDADGQPAPDQPWYDGGDYTLLAAPKRLSADTPGTRLHWTDLREALWRCYQPFADLQVRATTGARLALHQCPAEPFSDTLVRNSGKTLKFARWPEPQPGSGAATALTGAWPTLSRYLAACLADDQAGRDDLPPRLADLPPPGACETLTLPGGFAVITEQGLFVLQDWRNDELDWDGIRREFENACLRLSSVRQSAVRVRELLDRTDACAQGVGSVRLLETQLSTETLRLNRRWLETSAETFDPGVRRLRTTLDQHWGLSGRIERVLQSIQQAETMLRTDLAARSHHRFIWLTTFGVPLILATILVTAVFKPDGPAPMTGFAWWRLLQLAFVSLLASLPLIAAAWGLGRLAQWWRQRGSE
jgi:hypothetical protein